MSHVDTIGRYQLVKQLAIGGMGRVFLARTTGVAGFERHVVIKTLDATHDDSFATMFLDEARVLGRMHHHHIAPMFEIDRDKDGSYFLVMEYVHGHNAQAVWERARELGAALPLDFALTVASTAASALHYAHTRRGADGALLDVVHRDVSLANLMVGFDGAVKLIDFGIAKAVDRATMTQAGYIKGKLGYMAPEQVNGGTIDRRTDIFALGIVLYELTTMTRAFRAPSDLETLQRIRKGDLVPPSKIVPNFPRGLELIIAKALRGDPQSRFQDADTMRREIEAFAHRQKLVMGDSAVSEVMGQLFEDVEPWRVEPDEPAAVEPIPAEISDHLTIPVDAMPPTVVRNLRAATELADQMVIEVHERADEDTPFADAEADPTAPLPTSSVTAPPERAPSVITSAPRIRPTNPPPLRDDATIPKATTASPPPVPAAPVRPATSSSRRKTVIMVVAGVAMLAAAAGVALAIGTVKADDPQTAAPPPTVLIAPAIAARSAPAPVHEAPPPPAPPPPTVPPAPSQIHIKITTDPADATVLLDGQRLGHTPFDGKVPAAPGTHTIKIRRRGYTTIKLDVQLDADVTRTLELQPAATDAGQARGDTASGIQERRSRIRTSRSAT